jgi:hypothetical protein
MRCVPLREVCKHKPVCCLTVKNFEIQYIKGELNKEWIAGGPSPNPWIYEARAGHNFRCPLISLLSVDPLINGFNGRTLIFKSIYGISA